MATTSGRCIEQFLTRESFFYPNIQHILPVFIAARSGRRTRKIKEREQGTALGINGQGGSRQKVGEKK